MTATATRTHRAAGYPAAPVISATTPAPAAPASAPAADLVGAERFLHSGGAAKAYVLSRPADAKALHDAGLFDLSYCRVKAVPDDEGACVDYLVDGKACDTLACAAAYILARYW